ncbi:hypothetical protein JOE30_003648 [Rhodococcus sp. PvP016]|uniref:Uncharacterized protein n=1 Tax=Rhodococcoides corynebacterioides TaxID=53972 RepID=A0ABS2KTX9_9NOCA|nr:hypothetical protein [Rhodococcus corynebacterioides]MBP1117851.1 hypothetical protein [Rhodococcus sp. PvP016]
MVGRWGSARDAFTTDASAADPFAADPFGEYVRTAAAARRIMTFPTYSPEGVECELRVYYVP